MEFDRFELLHVLADSTNRSLDVLAAHEINGIMAPGDAPLVVLMNQSGVLERSIGERCPNSAKEEGLPYGIGTTTELSLGTTMCNTPLSLRAPRDSSAVAHKDVSGGRPPVRGRSPVRVRVTLHTGCELAVVKQTFLRRVAKKRGYVTGKVNVDLVTLGKVLGKLLDMVGTVGTGVVCNPEK